MILLNLWCAMSRQVIPGSTVWIHDSQIFDKCFCFQPSTLTPQPLSRRERGEKSEDFVIPPLLLREGVRG